MPKFIKNIQMVDNESLMKEFLEIKKLQGRGEFTISAAEFTLNKFLGFYQGDMADSKGLAKAIQEFLLGKSNAYYNKQLSILGQYFRFCIENKLIKKNPCNGLKFRRCSARIIDHDEQTIRKFLSLPNQRTFSGFRDYVFMILMLDTGIRPYEAIQLVNSDIQENTVRVRAEVSKTRVERYLPISAQCSLLLKKLIAVRDISWNEKGEIFCSYCGEKLHRKAMQLRFLFYSKKIGVNITAYHLRHTFALWFIRNGGSAFALQKILGHTTLEMTKTYVNIAMTDVRKNHLEFSPLKNFTVKTNVRVTKI